jgi:hypothetical protein
MKKQTFVVTLDILSSFNQCSPRIEAERLANIIRDGVEAKSCSFMGSIPSEETPVGLVKVSEKRA